MTSALASIAALLLSVLIVLAGSGLQFSLIPLRAADAGFPALALGLIGSAYFVGMTVGCLGLAALIRRAGHIRAFAACTAIATAVPLLHALIVDPYAWAVLRFVSGACFASIYAIIESWLNDRAENAVRGQILATYNVVNYLAMALGAQLLWLYPPQGFELFSICAMLISIAALPIALTRTTAPPVPTSPRLRPMILWRLSPVGVIGVMGVGLANGAFWSLAAVFAANAGFAPGEVANFVTAAILGGVLSLWPLGRLSDRIDRRLVIVAASVASAVAGLAMVLLAHGAGRLELYALSALFGFAAMPIYAVAVAHANDYAAPEDMVEVATGLLLVYCVGAVIGPTVASAVMERTTPAALFGFTAVIHVALAAAALVRMRMRSAPPPEAREAFTALPRTSPVAAELDPRAHAGEPDTPTAEGQAAALPAEARVGS